MKTRCKFKVEEVAECAYDITVPSAEDPNKWVSSGKKVQRVRFSAHYGPDPDSVSFSQATPSGTLDITVTNPAVHGMFKPGQLVYLDITPIE